jgi:hypothetical protein
MRKAILDIRPVCPKCGKLGQVTRKLSDGLIRLRCNACKHDWSSESGTCPKCGKSNGYPADGLCKACYSKLREERSLAI